MKFSERIRIAATLCVFAAIFIALAVGSYTRKSATWDEPQHLTAGYAALTRFDFRIDSEHPPVARMWAAFPLALSYGIQFDTNSMFWINGPQWHFCHQFMYYDNNADWMLYRARLMNVLLGVLLGVLLFCWARELFGTTAATAALALFCFEPNILAHAGLVTTDFAIVCFGFGAVYFLWRLTRRFSAVNLAMLTLFFVLAQTSKFTALLLWPVVVVLLGAWAWREKNRQAALRALGVTALLVVSTYVAIWAAYGFRYETTAGTKTEHFATEFANDLRVRTASPLLRSATGFVCKHRLLPQAYAEGFLLGQAKAAMRASYCCGRYSSMGWWWYFPVSFLLKTPVTLIAVLAAGVILQRRALLFLLWPIAVFLGVAMLAHLNIGLRHVLTIYPFVLLLACGAFVQRRWLVVLAPCLMAAELLLVYPDCIAAFNIVAGGPSRGDSYLVDSNLDWGQDLKGLKKWMDENNVSEINLSYFGTADPAYYGIRCVYLPGSPFFADKRVSGPKLPGYVAVSLTNLRGVYFSPEARRFFTSLLERKPVARIGNSIQVYWIESPWWREGK